MGRHVKTKAQLMVLCLKTIANAFAKNNEWVKTVRSKSRAQQVLMIFLVKMVDIQLEI